MKDKETSRIIDNAANNAQIAAKSAADSATVIAVVANDVNWMKRSLAGIEQTLSEMSKAFVTAAQHTEVIKSIDDHEARLNSLETEKTRVTVLVVIGGSLLGFLVTLMVYHITG